MTLPDPLRKEQTDQLQSAGPGRAVGAVAAGTTGRVAARVQHHAGRGRSLAARAVGKAVRTGLGPLGARLQNVVAELDRLRDRVDRIETAQVESALARSAIERAHVESEVLRSEIGEITRRLDAVGESFAPTAGVEAAGHRFAELREQVNALERRSRQVDAELRRPAAAPGPSPAAADAEGATESETARFVSEAFNYVAFERRFRGDPDDVLATQAERYADLLAGHGPLVDIGCGRGELLELLSSRGTECIGVEPDAGMVAEARARGVTVEHTDAITFLESVAPGTLGAIFSAHVLEHVPVPVMLRMIELSASRLAPGGMFVAETPNPASLIVLGESFILDPTHVRPIHPALLAFLCETAGFRDVRLEFFAPASHHQLVEIDTQDRPAWLEQLNANTRKLNDVLFGPQDYAVIARTPPG